MSYCMCMITTTSDSPEHHYPTEVLCLLFVWFHMPRMQLAVTSCACVFLFKNELVFWLPPKVGWMCVMDIRDSDILFGYPKMKGFPSFKLLAALLILACISIVFRTDIWFYEFTSICRISDLQFIFGEIILIKIPSNLIVTHTTTLSHFMLKQWSNSIFAKQPHLTSLELVLGLLNIFHHLGWWISVPETLTESPWCQTTLQSEINQGYHISAMTLVLTLAIYITSIMKNFPRSSSYLGSDTHRNENDLPWTFDPPDLLRDGAASWCDCQGPGGDCGCPWWWLSHVI